MRKCRVERTLVAGISGRPWEELLKMDHVAYV